MHSVPKPHPFGRFVVDVPGEPKFRYSMQAYKKFSELYVHNTSRERFNMLFEQRIKKHMETPNKEGGSQLIKVGHNPTLQNAHSLLYWKNDFCQIEAVVNLYWLEKGKLFEFERTEGVEITPTGRAGFYSPEHEEAYNFKLANSIRYRDPAELPLEPGYCFDHGFIAGEPIKPHRESVMLEVSWPEHPDVFVRILAMTVGPAVEEGLLARNKKNDTYRLFPFSFKTVRARKRVVGPFQGEELVEWVREKGTRNLSLTWESMGEEPRSTLNPHLLMEMVTGWSPDGPVKCSMTEDEILRLWDAMVESLRLRPTGPGDGKDGGPDPAPRGEPVEPGRRVASGNLCPADGLWRCDHPDNLLGHQRFYKAGTKFLAAVVPAKHGPLAKLFRRPQERWVPTTWTLLPREPEESAGR